jgi:hypothetical protein
LVFGYRFLCQPLDSLPGFDYAGQGLPKQYDGNPSALARDYDVVVFGAGSARNDPVQFQESWATTLQVFARVNGRGLVLVGDYRGGAGMTESAFDALNSIANDAKARFNRVSLAWGKATWGK